MKLKKALSGILAAAMVVSLTPAMAFATTSYTVSNAAGTVAKNTTFDRTIELEIKDSPNLWAGRAVGDDGVDADEVLTVQEINLKVENADYVYKTSGGDEKTTSKLSAEAFAGSNIYCPVKALVVGKDGASRAADIDATISRSSDSSVTLTIKAVGAGDDLATGDKIQITLHLKSKSKAGDVTLSLSSDDGDIDPISSKTIATVVGGKTTAVVSDYGTDDLATLTVRKSGQDGSEITIKEVTAGCLGTATQKITLMLPSDVEWNKTTMEGSTPYSGTLKTAGSGGGVSASVDGRKLTITITPGDDLSTRRSFTIKPQVDTKKGAAEGDVSVTLRTLTGDITEASDLVIGTIGESDVTVYVDEDDYKSGEIPTIFSGMVYDNTAEKYMAIITLEEKNKGDLTAGKYVDFKFNQAVQLSGIVKYDPEESGKVTTGLEDATIKYNKNRDGFAWEVTTASFSATEGSKVKFYIPFTVEAGVEGDITCTVAGASAGVDEQTVTVATVAPIISVTSEKSEVKTGIQNQKISDIVIKETKAGALSDYLDSDYCNDVIGITDDDDAEANQKFFNEEQSDSVYNIVTSDGTPASSKFTGKAVRVELPFALSADATVKVTEGDLEIENVSASKGDDYITFNIKASSVKTASTITISDIQVSLNRIGAEGGYDIDVCGAGVVQNAGFGKDQAFANAYTLEDVINIITPAESTTVSEKVDAKFVIGEASYTNNGTATEMDAAAYIDSHNRTMVPIRYVANACGISENDIRWEAGSQTAIINGLNTVVTVKMGSNKLQTSTGEITMDTVAVNNNGRIYVPVRYIANALGANVSWDAVTKTVTLTK